MLNKLIKRHWWRHNLYVSYIKWLPLNKKKSRFLKDSQMFFVLSTGRTGTKWMSKILSSVVNSHIVHEPIPVEAYAHMQAVFNQDKAENYIKTVKCNDVYHRLLMSKCDIYGEINGNLRRHIPFLKKHFPKASLLHLVRDGRHVVRSVLARNTFNGHHPVFGTRCPLPSQELSQAWSGMSEFEKACWVWKEENEQMRKQIPNLARLEDITSSFKAFQMQVLEPLDLSLTESDWIKYSGTKVNETKKNKVRLTEEWTEEQEKMFKSICGNEMKALGYC